MSSMTILFVVGLCFMLIEVFIILKHQLQEPTNRMREKLTKLEKELQELD